MSRHLAYVPYRGGPPSPNSRAKLRLLEFSGCRQDTGAAENPSASHLRNTRLAYLAGDGIDGCSRISSFA